MERLKADSFVYKVAFYFTKDYDMPYHGISKCRLFWQFLFNLVNIPLQYFFSWTFGLVISNIFTILFVGKVNYPKFDSHKRRLDYEFVEIPHWPVYFGTRFSIMHVAILYGNILLPIYFLFCVDFLSLMNSCDIDVFSKESSNILAAGFILTPLLWVFTLLITTAYFYDEYEAREAVKSFFRKFLPNQDSNSVYALAIDFIKAKKDKVCPIIPVEKRGTDASLADESI